VIKTSTNITYGKEFSHSSLKVAPSS